MNHDRAREIYHELQRKLFLLCNERKIAKRRELLDSILEEEGEQLKKLLELKE